MSIVCQKVAMTPAFCMQMLNNLTAPETPTNKWFIDNIIRESVHSIHADSTMHDSTVYCPYLNKSKINKELIREKVRQNQHTGHDGTRVEVVYYLGNLNKDITCLKC